LESSPVVYKIVGGIMISIEKPALQKELQGRKELFELRVQTLEKQEKQLKDKAKKLQEEVLASVKE
jgi:prefoldin beta subunit